MRAVTCLELSNLWILHELIISHSRQESGAGTEAICIQEAALDLHDPVLRLHRTGSLAASNHCAQGADAVPGQSCGQESAAAGRPRASVGWRGVQELVRGLRSAPHPQTPPYDLPGGVVLGGGYGFHAITFCTLGFVSSASNTRCSNLKPS